MICGIDEAHFNAEFGKERGEEPIGSPVDDVGGEKMIAGRKMGEYHCRLCGHARGECETCFASFQRADLLDEGRMGGRIRSGADVSVSGAAGKGR